jgi:hypothetical protein
LKLWLVACEVRLHAKGLVGAGIAKMVFASVAPQQHFELETLADVVAVLMVRLGVLQRLSGVAKATVK